MIGLQKQIGETYDNQNSKAVTLVGDNKLNKALTIVSKFRRLPKEQLKVFGDGHSALTNTRFYVQLKGEAWVADAIQKAYNELYVWAKAAKKEVV